MMIKVPGKKPAVVNSFTELLDLYPTLADLAGLEYPAAIQGKSLVPVLHNPKKKVRDYAFSVTQGGKSFLIRTDKWAYIQYNEDASAGMELFDMENDPQQFTNLAHDPAYKKVVTGLQSKLKQKLVEVRDNDLGKVYTESK